MLPINSNGIILDKEQLKKYIENIASGQKIGRYSKKETYPVLWY